MDHDVGEGNDDDDFEDNASDGNDDDNDDNEVPREADAFRKTRICAGFTCWLVLCAPTRSLPCA